MSPYSTAHLSFRWWAMPTLPESLPNHPIQLFRIRRSPFSLPLAPTLPPQFINPPIHPFPENDESLPLMRTSAQSMLHRIVMQIIKMSSQNPAHLESCVPKTAAAKPDFPDAAPATPFTFSINFSHPAPHQRCPRKQHLHPPNPPRKIGITLGQRPNKMQMIRQHHSRHQLKPSLLFHLAQRHPQPPNILRVGKQFSSPIRHNRKKERPARPPHSPIFRHPCNINPRLQLFK